VYKCQPGIAPSYLANKLSDCLPYVAVNYWRQSLSCHHSSHLELSAAACHVCTITVCLPQLSEDRSLGCAFLDLDCPIVITIVSEKGCRYFQTHWLFMLLILCWIEQSPLLDSVRQIHQCNSQPSGCCPLWMLMTWSCALCQTECNVHWHVFRRPVNMHEDCQLSVRSVIIVVVRFT